MREVKEDGRRATREEMQMAILMGKLLSRENGVATYEYRGEIYVLDAIRGTRALSASKVQR